MKFDLIIKNGKIIDGSGNPWYKADMGIVGETIKKIGEIKKFDTEKTIDANSMIIAPGFIDIHSHSDIPVLVDPEVHSKIRQGVTTEVVGNCGSSAAPMNASLKEYREKYARTRVPDDFKFDWESMADYLNKIESQGSGFNVASFVGHGTIRQNVMGHNASKPTKEELEEMKKLVANAMKDGAWGMSTGLIYPPSVFAETEEIIELSKIVANYSGIYASHIRGEGESLLEAIVEAGEIGEKSGTPVQIAHFKASGKPNWGMTKDSLALVKKYRNMGIDITFDQYPYIAGSTGLKSLFPHWAHEGGAEKMIKRLKDPKIRKKMRDQLRPDKEWNQIMVAYAKNHPEYNGKNIEEIAELENKDPYDSVCDLLIAEDNQVQIVTFGMDEEDVRRVMRSPFGMVGSDGSAISPYGILGQGNPHPRYYGTFPRVLGYYVREEVLSLPEAVRKMTSAPAQKLGIKDRGLLRQGYKADLTIFDPDNIKDNATFTNPHQYPSGIPFVMVNGALVVEKDEHTGALPGKTLRKS
jgi:N-acyl-D-amino-acid deacylase